MAIAARFQQEIGPLPTDRAARQDKSEPSVDNDQLCMECMYSAECPEGRNKCHRDTCKYYTICQIRRHATVNSAWLVAGENIYDATEYLHRHPGGMTSILKKAGGVCDCTEDLNFHSKAGRRLWKKYFIGKVKSCPKSVQEHREWWQFWM